MPEVLLTDTPRIMSLRNPKEKMSKSDKNVNSRIDLSSTDDEIALRIRKAVTDSEPYISSDLSGRPGVKNLVDIISAFSGQKPETITTKYEGVEYFTGTLKAEVTDTVIRELTPIREKYNQLICDRSYLDKILQDGSKKADEIASDTMKSVYSRLGMR